MVSLVRAARVAATGLLAAGAVAAVASPAQASTTHRGLSMSGLGAIRHVILQSAMGGAAVMLLLTAALLLLGRASKAPARPKPQLAGPAGADNEGRSSVPATAEADVVLASRASKPTAVDPDSSTDDESSWPDSPALPSDTERAAAAAPSQITASPEAAEPDERAESAFPPAALRVLGASPLGQRGDGDAPAQRHQVALGDDQIEVVLAARPGDSEHAATRYVRWAPLPYDIPDDGLAFACIGAGDEGCLFVDLAAAPGAVAITGDTGAAVRLAESVVHQLSASIAADQAISLLIVGSSVPRPHPANATSVGTLRDLATASLDSSPDNTDIVFCELSSDEDALTLARHVASSRHRVVPVVLGHLPDTAWSFTAFASLPLDGAQPALEGGGLHYS